MEALKLYMLLLGATPPGRNTEQHDIFFGIAPSLPALIPQIKLFWPDAVDGLHIDAWREVSYVDGYSISVEKANTHIREEQLFFINLGGYQRGIFDEPHFKLLTVQKDKGAAVQRAKDTAFYKQARFPGANSHIDEHYGVDIDDVHNVAEILPASQKGRYVISITKANVLAEDEIHLGYFRLNKL